MSANAQLRAWMQANQKTVAVGAETKNQKTSAKQTNQTKA